MLSTNLLKNKKIFLVFAIVFTICAYLNNHDFLDEFKKFDTIIRIDANASISTDNYSFNNLLNDLLHNTTEILLKYINLPFDYRYGSNQIPLTVACLLTNGDFLELGLGMFSTPLLHRLAIHSNRYAVSIDSEFDWANKFKFYNLTKSHKIHVMNIEQMNEFGLSKQWGVVLVDHSSGGNRHLNMIKFCNTSTIVIGHDAEKWYEHYYKYEEKNVKDFFKYSCKFSIYVDEAKLTYVSTLILSNFVDVSRLKLVFDNIVSDYGHVSCDMGF